jgi:hypothetical protein
VGVGSNRYSMPVLICCYQTPESWVSSIAAWADAYESWLSSFFARSTAVDLGAQQDVTVAGRDPRYRVRGQSSQYARISSRDLGERANVTAAALQLRLSESVVLHVRK